VERIRGKPTDSPFEKEPAPYLIRGRLRGILNCTKTLSLEGRGLG